MPKNDKSYQVNVNLQSFLMLCLEVFIFSPLQELSCKIFANFY